MISNATDRGNDMENPHWITDWETLIAGSKSSVQSFAQWSDIRRFCMPLIATPGAVLDVGCANGLWLQSVCLWRNLPLQLYGIDSDRDAITQAVQLGLPQPLVLQHIDVRSVAAGSGAIADGMPACFDYIYWNIPALFTATDIHNCAAALFARLKKGGRLIAAVYNAVAYVDVAAYDEFCAAASSRLLRGLSSCGRVSLAFNRAGNAQMAGWVDKDVVDSASGISIDQSTEDVSMATILLEPGESFDHMHATLSESILVDGAVHYEAAGKRFSMRRGEHVVAQAGERHVLHNTGSTVATVNCIHRQ